MSVYPNTPPKVVVVIFPAHGALRRSAQLFDLSGMSCPQLNGIDMFAITGPSYLPSKNNFSLFLPTECKFRCTNGRCLKLLSLICNHLNECGDNSDEEHCPPAAVPPPPDTIQCKCTRPTHASVLRKLCWMCRETSSRNRTWVIEMNQWVMFEAVAIQCYSRVQFESRKLTVCYSNLTTLRVLYLIWVLIW